MSDDHYNRLHVAVELGHAISRIEEMQERLIASDEALRLALGELSAQDIRNIRAAFNWVMASQNCGPEQVE